MAGPKMKKPSSSSPEAKKLHHNKKYFGWIRPSVVSAAQYTLSRGSPSSLSFVKWLTQGGPKHPKHCGWLHPIAVFLLHYSVVSTFIVAAHDWMVALYYANESAPLCHVDDSLQTQRTLAAVWFLAYAVFLLACRLFFKAPEPGQAATIDWSVLYDYCWMCNGTLWLGAWALYTGRPILASALCITVGMDQMLWYVDVAGFFLTSKFPVGVAKYLMWPQNANWFCRMQCTHHLWTIPLLLGVSRTGTLHILSYFLAHLFGIVNVSMSRWLTPHTIERPDSSETKYLNINMAHEMWKDITMGFTHKIADRDAPTHVFLFQMLVLVGGSFNSIAFSLLYCLSWLVTSGAESRLC